jgi:hypothetical protein
MQFPTPEAVLPPLATIGETEPTADPQLSDPALMLNVPALIARDDKDPQVAALVPHEKVPEAVRLVKDPEPPVIDVVPEITGQVSDVPLRAPDEVIAPHDKAPQVKAFTPHDTVPDALIEVKVPDPPVIDVVPEMTGQVSDAALIALAAVMFCDCMLSGLKLVFSTAPHLKSSSDDAVPEDT